MSDSESSVELPVQAVGRCDSTIAQTKEKKATKPSLLSALREKRVALESDQREAAAAAKGLKEKTAKPPKREVEKPVKKTASDKIVAAAKEPEPESEPDVERAERSENRSGQRPESAHNARRSIETVVVKKEKKPKKIVYIEEESSEEEEVIVRRPKKKEATQPQHRPLAAAILRSHSPTKKRMPPPQKVQAAPVALTGYNLLDNLLFSGR